MIIGTGVDLVDISRIARWLENDRLCNRFFHEDELQYVRSRGPGAPRSLAAGFAAKEAFAKALGTGFDGFALREIRVERKASGQPMLIIEGKALNAMIISGAKTAHLSLSHEGNLAIAQVILEA